MKETTPMGSMPGDAISSARAIAISAGDLSVMVREQVKRVLEENQNDVVKSISSGLEELVRRALITSEESESLRDACSRLVNAIRGKEDPDDAFFAIRKAYQAMLLDQASSPSALAIASVAASAFDLEKSNSVSITPMKTGAGAVIGAVLGGIVGGIVGGGLGAGVGAAVGGAAGAAIGWCNENGT